MKDDKTNSELPEGIKERFIKGFKMARLKDIIGLSWGIAVFMFFYFWVNMASPYLLAFAIFALFILVVRLISYHVALRLIRDNEYIWYTDRTFLLGRGFHVIVDGHYMRILSEHIIAYDTWARGDVYVISFNKRPFIFLKNFCLRVG